MSSRPFSIRPPRQRIDMRLLTLVSVMLAGMIFKNIVRKERRAQERMMAVFWERERRARMAVSDVSVDSLPFIQIPEGLPLSVGTGDPQAGEYQQIIRNLSARRVINLNGLSNTEIRLKYGAANFRVLSQADQNFLVLARTLTALAERYIEEGYMEEAGQLLEYSREIHSDIRRNEELMELVGRWKDSFEGGRVQENAFQGKGEEDNGASGRGIRD